jgi:hypothetical protein
VAQFEQIEPLPPLLLPLHITTHRRWIGSVPTTLQPGNPT